MYLAQLRRAVMEYFRASPHLSRYSMLKDMQAPGGQLHNVPDIDALHLQLGCHYRNRVMVERNCFDAVRDRRLESFETTKRPPG
jgi:hypothetical protein